MQAETATAAVTGGGVTSAPPAAASASRRTVSLHAQQVQQVLAVAAAAAAAAAAQQQVVVCRPPLGYARHAVTNMLCGIQDTNPHVVLATVARMQPRPYACGGPTLARRPSFSSCTTMSSDSYVLVGSAAAPPTGSAAGTSVSGGGGAGGGGGGGGAGGGGGHFYGGQSRCSSPITVASAYSLGSAPSFSALSATIAALAESGWYEVAPRAAGADVDAPASTDGTLLSSHAPLPMVSTPAGACVPDVRDGIAAEAARSDRDSVGDAGGHAPTDLDGDAVVDDRRREPPGDERDLDASSSSSSSDEDEGDEDEYEDADDTLRAPVPATDNLQHSPLASQPVLVNVADFAMAVTRAAS